MDIKAIFEGFDHEKYQHEAEHSWGQDERFREAAERTKKYNEQEWLALKTEVSEIYQALFALSQTGVPASDEACRNLAERHRLHIDKWFFPCDRATHLALAQLYETDHRFAENIDKNGLGLCQFLIESIRANDLVGQN